MTTVRTVHVAADTATERIDRFLARVLGAETSRTQLQRLIREGRVRCDGELVTPRTAVRPGQMILVEFPPPTAPEGVAPEPVPFEILYEDETLLLVNKPAGLTVHPGAGCAHGTLVHGLLAHTQSLSRVAGPMKPGLVHRLDKDTSGIMVVAKDDVTHRALARQFADRTVQRTYLALVDGAIAREQGTISARLGRHPIHRQRIAVQPADRGREAITRYRVLRRWPGMTLVELRPETGRTHQLRVHLAHLGHPILGDPHYGPKGRGPAEVVVPRQALHAFRLGFVHPATGETVEFTAPLPEDLAAPLR